MQKKALFLSKIFLYLVLFWGVERFCHKQTKGFQLHKILTMQDPDSADPCPLPAKEQKEIAELLEQPFYFFGRGGQCYAFIGQDGKTMIKFFKNHHVRFWKFLNSIPLPKALKSYQQRILRKNLHQSPAFFESCKISYLEFKERTGLIYLHLHKTDYFKKRLTIVDRLGIAHQVDADTVDFALQKKAEMTYPKLQKLIKENHLDAAKQCIRSLLNLIVERCEKGIQDRDPNIRRNVGYIGNQAIEIDIGSYSKNESLKRPEHFKQELLNNTQKFKEWLQQRNPDLSFYLSRQVDEVLKEAEKNELNSFSL